MEEKSDSGFICLIAQKLGKMRACAAPWFSSAEVALLFCCCWMLLLLLLLSLLLVIGQAEVTQHLRMQGFCYYYMKIKSLLIIFVIVNMLIY